MVGPVIPFAETDWVEEHYRRLRAQNDCNLHTVYQALYDRVCFDLDQATKHTGRPGGYFHVHFDTDHSFQVIEGKDLVLAVFAKWSEIIRGVTLQPPNIVGQYKELASYEGTPTIDNSFQCVLRVGTAMLTVGQFSKLILSPKLT